LTEKRLLIVEDEAPLRELLAEYLVEAGFAVTEAEDADHAVAMLEGIDLLITDLDMPGRLDGNAIATKAKVRHPGLPVIYASGRPERLTNRIDAHDAFVDKPFGPAQIAKLVRRLLDQSSAAPH
jgi:DNA-binding response OmpR family regulator